MGEGAIDAGRQLIDLPQREQLTEAEAVRLGQAAHRLARYRFLRDTASVGGSINVAAKGGMVGENLPNSEVQAALSFLIEREELFLASYNVKIERPNG